MAPKENAARGTGPSRRSRACIERLEAAAWHLGPGWIIECDLEGPLHVRDAGDGGGGGFLIRVRSDDVLRFSEALDAAYRTWLVALLKEEGHPL